jgi:hypothetical protein
MSDLFISYSSYDRPWAERLYNDVRRSFPTIHIFWDRDSASIPPGTNWAKVLEDEAKAARHLVVIWSKKAEEKPTQLAAEIEGFKQSRQDGDGRTLFYIPLDEKDYANLGQTQGFAELRRRQTYDPQPDDRGTSKLDVAPHRAEWRRVILDIGNAVLKAQPTLAIKLALLVMNENNRDLIDPFLKLKVGPGPTLQEVLVAAGLSLAQVKARYGENAFAWTPFGPGRTIIELMEELQVAVNAGLNAEHRFHWEPCDLFEVLGNIENEIDFRNQLDELSGTPSALVIDAISLFNPAIRLIFPRLVDYAKKEHAIILSLAPNEAPTADRLYQCLRANGAPVLDGYFLPQIPSAGPFARCCMNVEHLTEIERLIRGSLGIYHLQRRKSEDKPLVALGA